VPFTALPVEGTLNSIADAIVRYSLESHRVPDPQAGARTLCYAQLAHRFFRLMLAVHSGRNLEVLADLRQVRGILSVAPTTLICHGVPTARASTALVIQWAWAVTGGQVLFSRLDLLLGRLPSGSLHDMRVYFELSCAREAIICMEDTSTLFQVS
jgi:hypothetical protein